MRVAAMCFGGGGGGGAAAPAPAPELPGTVPANVTVTSNPSKNPDPIAPRPDTPAASQNQGSTGLNM